MKNSRAYFRSALVIFLVITSFGCATKPVTESMRDVAGTYDGVWKTVDMNTIRTQYTGLWTFNCSGSSEEFAIMIENSVVRLFGDTTDSTQFTYIDDKGHFLLKIPSTQRATASEKSDVLFNSKVTTSIEANLSEENPTGSLVIGIARANNRGCKTTFSLNKI